MSENELSSSNFEPDTKMEAEESRAVFVDTNLQTHLIVPIFSHSTVTSLKRRLRKEHLDCFPQLGRIEINALSVKLRGSYYRLPDYMLLKTAFRGVGDTWSVYADIWTAGSCLESHKYIECKPLETRPLHQIGSQHTNSSPQTHVSLDMSSGKMKRVKKKKKRNGEEKKVENNYIGVKEKSIEKTRQSWQLDVPRADEISATKQVDKPSKGHHYTSVLHPSVMLLKDGGDNIVKDLEKGAGMVPQLTGTSTKLPEALNKESGIDTSLPMPRVKKSKKKKKGNIGVIESPAATFDQEPDILVKADAPADNKYTIYKTDSIKIAEEVSPSQPNNVSELLLQHDSLKLEKETVEDVVPLKTDNAARKKKRGRSGQEITAEKATPMHLNNVPELLLPQEKSLNLIDREKEIEEDIVPLKSENPAKRKKSNKSKSYGTENQESLSKRKIDDKKEDDMRNCLPDDISRPEKAVETISENPQMRFQNEKAVLGKDPHEEVQKLEAPPLKSENPAKRKKSDKFKSSGTENQEPKMQIDDQKEDDMKNRLPDDISGPEMCVETISETLQKRSQNEKAVLGKDLHEEVQKLEAPKTVIQSENSRILSHKKQAAPAVGPPSLPVDQHLDAPIKVDDNLTTCDAIVEGVLLKSDKSAKKRITNGSEQEHKTAAKVSHSHLNIAPDLSRDESVYFADRTKKIKEKVSPPKSEPTMKKRNERRDSQKKKKENDVLTENYDLSSKKQSDIDKPEESVDTMGKSLKKRSLNEEVISSRVPPGSSLKEKPDEETRESTVPKTVIESNKPLRRSQRKLSVSGKDLSSLPGNHTSADKKMDVDAPKSVEEADDPPTSHTDGVNNQKKMIQVEGHHDDSKEIPSLAASSVLSESRHLASKQKAKKNDQPSAVDTSSNGQKIVESKKNRGHAITSELQKSSTVQSHEKSEPPLTDILVPVADIKTNKKTGVSCASVDDGSSISGKKILRETVAPKRVDQADDLFTDAESIGAQEHKEVIQDDEHNGEFSQAPQIEVSTVLAEAAQLEKPKASKQKARKVDQSPSIDTSSNGRDLLGFKKNKGSAKTYELQKPIADQKHDKSIPPLSIKNSKVLNEVNTTVADPTNISRNGGVSRASVDGGSKSSDAVKKPLEGGKAKDPPKRLEENPVGLRKSSLSNPKQSKKRLPSQTIFDDESSSSSSDDEDRNNTLSSSATLPPDNLSSSDYSEGESEGVVISQPDPSNDNEISKANSSGSKLGSILRSSSRYKKAKLVAFQSQDDSEVPEFVPDSLPDV